MRRSFFFTIFLLYLLSFSFPADASLYGTQNNPPSHPAKKGISITAVKPYVTQELLIKYKASFSSSSIQALHSHLAMTEIQHFEQINVRHIRLPADIPLASAISELENDPAVAYAEPNYTYRVCATPSDAYFSSLWGLHNTGQEVNGTRGAPRADINATAAWDIAVGNSEITVAVIDTGVDYLHSDLAANISEARHNFISYNDDPMDVYGHGTHVAGIIAATGNNQAGVTGVAWSATLMPLRAGDDSGLLPASAIIAAIDYARLNGAKIINASYGGPHFSQAMFESIDAAGKAGILFVAAAGNNVGNIDDHPFYPASYPLDNIIAVAATDQYDELSYFSNYGESSVHVGAPGHNIYSTKLSPPMETDPASAQNSEPAIDEYQFMSGTSMATAYVSGLAALIWGYHPALTYAQVKDIILRGVDLRSSLSGKTVSGGRINAFKALNFCVHPPAPGTLSASADFTGQIHLSWEADVYAVTYVLERKQGADGYYTPVATMDGNLNRYIDSDLDPATPYAYRLKAVNYGGESTYSNEADATTWAINDAGDSGGGSSGCFIATAAFGSPMDRHVQILRTFRDHYLMPFTAGQAVVKFYYKTSPPIARIISENSSLRWLTRLSLLPAIGLSYLIITWGGIPTLLGLIFLIIGLAVVIARQGKNNIFTDFNMKEHAYGNEHGRICKES